MSESHEVVAFFRALSKEHLVQKAVQLDKMLAAERRMTIELTARASHPLLAIRTYQDRHAEFLIAAMKMVMGQHPNVTSPDWIVSQASAIADGLWTRHMAKWSGG